MSIDAPKTGTPLNLHSLAQVDLRLALALQLLFLLGLQFRVDLGPLGGLVAVHLGLLGSVLHRLDRFGSHVPEE